MFGRAEPGQQVGDRRLQIEVGRARLSLDALPVAVDDPREPQVHLLLDEVHVVEGVVRAHLDRLALRVRRARGVDDVEDDVCVRQLVEELVAQPLPLVGTRNQPGHVEEFDGDVPLSVAAVLVATALVAVETGALSADVCHAAVGVDRRERVVGHVDVGHRGGGIKGGLASVRLARQRDRDHGGASRPREKRLSVGLGESIIFRNVRIGTAGVLEAVTAPATV